MTLSNTDIALYLVPGILNILFSSFIVGTYLASRDLRKHPSGLIASLSLCEIVMTYHSIIFATNTNSFIEEVRIYRFLMVFSFREVDEDLATKILCGVNQVMLTAAMVGCICYNIAICLDLIVSLWSPFIPGRKRTRVYSGLILVAIVYFTYWNAEVNKFINKCEADEDSRLGISNKGNIVILLIIFMVVGVVSILYAGFRFARGLRLETEMTKQYFRRHVAYVAVFSLQWIFPAISFSLHYFSSPSKLIDRISIFAISSSGIFTGLIRIQDKAFFNKLKEWYFFTVEEEHEEDDAWNLPISVLVFGNLNLELAHCIFASLFGVFKENTKYKYETTKQFTNSTFNKVSKHSLEEYVSETAQLWGIESSKMQSVIIEEYCPDVFQQIRILDSLSLEKVLESLDPLLNKESIFRVDESKGKSGSFFLFTNDSLLTIKTIKRNERKEMLRFLKDYYFHLRENKDSLLCRVYGVFSLKVPGIASMDIMVMRNVLYRFEPIRTYDIKGSTKGRTSIRNGKIIGPLKDMDFKKMRERIQIDTLDCEKLLKVVLLDVQLLRKYNFIDYSMLVSIGRFKRDNSLSTYNSLDQKWSYRLGVIDFLTKYNYWKWLEEAFSSQEASVKDPESYANRFFNFMFSKVVPIIKPKSSFSIEWSSFVLAN